MNLDFEQQLIYLQKDVFTPEECLEWIALIEAAEPSHAPITTAYGPIHNSHVRNNDRVMFDDVEAARNIFERVQEYLPRRMFGQWSLLGCNERLRCYRYTKGQRFAPHGDGAFKRNERERSFYTLLLYLSEGFEGGETNFMVEPPVSVVPEIGMACLFQHPIYHEGAEVTRGTKYVLRTDVMYEKVAF